MNQQDTNRKSYNQLEIDNKYLLHQNELLNKELSFTRYTINALKSISTQKDIQLNETRQELEKALKQIQLLSFTLKQQQDHDLSADDASLSEEDDILLFNIYKNEQRRSILSKLPLRHQAPKITHHNDDDNIFVASNHFNNDIY